LTLGDENEGLISHAEEAEGTHVGCGMG